MRYFGVLPLSLLITVMSGSGASRPNDAASPQVRAPGAGPESQAKLPLVRDREVNEILTRLGRKISAQADSRGIPYTFYLIDAPQVNSFSAPGGYVYVTRGAVAGAGNASELLALLSHEIAHVVERDQPTLHTPAIERNADRLGASLMMRAGFAPYGAVTMLRKLLAAASKPDLRDYLTAHPLSEERLRNLEAFVAAIPGSSSARLVTDNDDYQRLRARLATLP